MRFDLRIALALAALSAAWMSAFAPDAALARACFQPDESKLDSHQHYESRSDGCDVHGPARSRDGSKPPGASARCRDGTWSFSHTRSGTCSRHGGVERWESGGLVGPRLLAMGDQVYALRVLVRQRDEARVASPVWATTSASRLGTAPLPPPQRGRGREAEPFAYP
ncbi:MULTISPECIES: DUF3761 domain-containing protein [unclassified Methylobacterium]|jgi:Protein of unknown function (DUF3761)|uniref:DUF3761 domain-containing protein n=1 Tax=unclassified Methylobacterium TaxID=2615210 RepID=UPI001352AB2D|nr:DUF3761 domain-containing protein [Methylobacterium sp. 2A]MWV21008.1 DUF3761 domain-containing protein [Methylobacterium sp. 2A]